MKRIPSNIEIITGDILFRQMLVLISLLSEQSILIELDLQPVGQNIAITLRLNLNLYNKKINKINPCWQIPLSPCGTKFGPIRLSAYVPQ